MSFFKKTETPKGSFSYSQNSRNSTAFTVLGVEFVIIAIVVGLVVGVLNYFLIFPISTMNPKLFGWLPVRSIIQKNVPFPTKGRDLSRVNEPGLPDKNTFQATTGPNDKENVTFLIDDVVKPNFIPNNIMLPQATIDKNRNLIYLWSNWKMGVDQFTSMIEYDKNRNIVAKKISIIINEAFINIDADKTKQISAKYIKIVPSAVFKCAPLKDINFNSNICEAFWEEKDGVKKSVFVQSPMIADKPFSLVNFCEFHNGSVEYDWKSCFPALDKEGVQ